MEINAPVPVVSRRKICPDITVNRRKNIRISAGWPGCEAGENHGNLRGWALQQPIGMARDPGALKVERSPGAGLRALGGGVGVLQKATGAL